MMWVNHQITNDFRKEYSATQKLLDVRSEHILEIFHSEKFGQIALIDEKDLIAQSTLSMTSELLAHIPACCLKIQESNINNHALVLDGFNLEIAYELLRHTMSVDYIQRDSKVLESFISFLPHFQATKSHEHFSLYEKAIDLPLRKYHIIIHQATPNAHELDGLSRMLTPDGVLICRLPNPYLSIESCSMTLKNLGVHFRIVMPFFAPFTDECFVFASRLTHPLADLWLQRADMLEDLTYYNADIHQAAFALPQALSKSLQQWIKN